MRKHSTRRPRALINPLTRMSPAPKSKRDRVMLSFHTALESMVSGRHPGEEEWRSLSDAVNSIETLVGMGKLLDHEVMPMVDAAIAAMVGAAKRYRAGNGMRLDGVGMEAMRRIIDVYDQCLIGFTEAEMAEAQHRTQERLNAIWRAKKMPDGVIAV